VLAADGANEAATELLRHLDELELLGGGGGGGSAAAVAAVEQPMIAAHTQGLLFLGGDYYSKSCMSQLTLETLTQREGRNLKAIADM
jgi:hypothetical protein